MVKHHEEPFDRFQQYYKTEEEIKLTTRESFKKFIWNPKEKEFCGRDIESWGKFNKFLPFKFSNTKKV